jgi:RHS repeat-associated protein
VQAEYAYDPYGRATQVSGSISCDFQFTGYYYHATSGLFLSATRAYNPNLGRFIQRDPSGESSGLNLYVYCADSPIDNTDSSGLCMDDSPGNGAIPPNATNFGSDDPIFDFLNAFAQGTLDPHAWQQSAAATINGLDPFGNPFAIDDPNSYAAIISHGLGQIGQLGFGAMAGALARGVSWVKVAVGPGAPFHVAFAADGTMLNGVGPIGWQTMKILPRYASETFANAYFTFSVPVASTSAVVATQGARASTCVTAAIYAIAKGWGL